MPRLDAVFVLRPVVWHRVQLPAWMPIYPFRHCLPSETHKSNRLPTKLISFKMPCIQNTDFVSNVFITVLSSVIFTINSSSDNLLHLWDSVEKTQLDEEKKVGRRAIVITLSAALTHSLCESFVELWNFRSQLFIPFSKWSTSSIFDSNCWRSSSSLAMVVCCRCIFHEKILLTVVVLKFSFSSNRS